MARTNSLTNFLTDVATAIKTKKGDDTAILASDFDTEILNLPSQGEYEEKVVNISQNGSQTITPGQDYDAISEITINTAVPQKQLQTKSYQFTQNAALQLTPDSGYDGFDQVNLTIDVTDPEYNTNLALSEQILGPVILPYTELEYIKGTGTQYIDTGFIPTDNTKIKLKIKDITTNDKMIISATSDWNSNRFLLTYYSNALRWYLPGEAYKRVDANSINEVEAYRGYYKVNDEVISNDTTSKTLTNLTNIFIWGSSYLENRNNGFKLYYFQIYDNEVLIRDFIPVRRKIDNEICLYDKVTEQFFTNQGTGRFIAGPEKV